MFVFVSYILLFKSFTDLQQILEIKKNFSLAKSSNICSYLGHFQTQVRKNKKICHEKNSYISGNGTFLPQNKLPKFFKTF